MNMPLPIQYGSVCSGIEAATLAWRPLGWQPAWFAEIDPFANAVLAHHYPHVPNLGDMTTLAARILSGEVPAPDILVGGTPCVSFSLGGARRGLADPRGSLVLTFTELANAIDHVRHEQHRPPVIVVWENVPGILSDRGNAFGVFLGALAGEDCPLEPPGGKWTHAGYVSGSRRIAWRALRAERLGLAQQRLRVFLVASARTGLDPGEILFEREGLRGHPAPGAKARQEAAGIAARRADCPDRPLCFGGNHTRGPIDQAACLTAKGQRGDFESDTFAVQSCTGPIAHTLTTANHGKGCGEDGSGRGIPIVAVALRGRAGGMTAELGGEVACTLRAGAGSGGKGYALQAEASCPHGDAAGRIWRIRRLMPVECERLQGLCKDNYTLVPYRGKPAADAPRYRVIGNSMAVPCMAWLGRRLHYALARETGANEANE
jgi:DNA (cytosine-5)-methyltransferase 1